MLEAGKTLQHQPDTQMKTTESLEPRNGVSAVAAGSASLGARMMKPETEWLDTRTGYRYVIVRVEPDNVAFHNAPGQNFICGGAHTPSAWIERVNDGTYELQPNGSHEPRGI